jgi:hypothetical protein
MRCQHFGRNRADIGFPGGEAGGLGRIDIESDDIKAGVGP